MTANDTLLSLLPHKGGMVLIDRVVTWTDQSIRCGAMSHTRLDNPLRRNNRLSVLVGVEYAGQAIAIHASLTSGRPLGKGVLASLRELVWTRDCLSDLSTELTIDAVRLVAGSGGARYDISVSSEDVLVLKGRATVAFVD